MTKGEKMKRRKLICVVLVMAMMLVYALPANAFANETSLADIAVVQNDVPQYEGQPFNSEGITVTAIYSNGAEVMLSDSDYEIGNFDSDSAGEKAITVSYGGIVKELTINITDADFVYKVGTERTLSSRSADEKDATWISSDSQVVEVIETRTQWVTETSGGEIYTGYKQFANIRAVKPGVAVLTCETSSGSVVGTAVISVNNPIETFWIDQTELFLETGNGYALKTLAVPADADETRVTWASSNPQIASVNKNGEITAHAQGETIVSAVSWDGKHRAECRVYVTDPEEKIDLVLPDHYREEGGMFAVQCFSYPEPQREQGFRITSSNAEIVSFEDGQSYCDFTTYSYDDIGILLKINGVGDVSLTAETEDGSLTDVLNLQITLSDEGEYIVTDRDDPADLLFEDQNTVRLYGANRYDTSISTAESLKKTWNVSQFENIIVADGRNYADALAGTYLAKVKNAPILLVGSDLGSQAQARDYIFQNLMDGGKVYILGGTGAVSSDFEAMIEELDVERLAGDDRWLTNLEILKEAGIYGQDIIVCSGTDFADSLSASAAGRPILLVGSSLYDVQAEYLDTLGAKKYYIVGGQGAVSEEIADRINTYGPVVRVAGENRYETSAAVARQFFGDESKAVILAYGDNFPDGLSGGPLAMAIDTPLLLVNSRNTFYAKEYADQCGADKGVILGGTTLISDDDVADIIGQ